MTDKEKLEKLKKFADAMYYAAKYLTTDASRLRKTMEDYHQFIIQNWHKEEPVSMDLGEYINELSKQFPEFSFAKLSRIAVRVANWQKEQFEKNRLAACDKQTEEEAEIERDFVIGIIENEHRQPTFDDAIKYGMRLQKEQMMTKSIEAVVSQVPCANEIILHNPSSVDYYYLPQEMNKLGLNKGDKIKLVIIKED